MCKFHITKLIINHLKMYNSVTFNIFVTLCNHHLYPVQKYFHHPKRKLCTFKQSLPVPSSSPALTATNLLFVSMKFPILDISHVWNHKIWGFLCLVA